MARHELTPSDATLIAIDVAKTHNEILVEQSGQPRRCRLTVLNTRADHDRLLELLGGLRAAVANQAHRAKILSPRRSIATC